MKRTLLSFSMLAVAAALSGCVSFGEKPPSSLMTLTADARVPADAGRTVAAGSTVLVSTPSTPQMLANDHVAVRSGATEIAYIKDGRWSDAPAKLFADLLAETIAAQTGRTVIDRRQYALSPGARLSGRLNAFEYDAGRGDVFVSYDAVYAPGGNQPPLARRFEARAASASDKPGAVGQALNQAANKVAADVAAWIGK